MKIKLVAIAKDEAAYLPEWIFHHFYFGVDEIEIYVNFTTDGTHSLLKKIQGQYPVKFKDVEYLIDPSHTHFDHLLSNKYLNKNPLQARAYAELFVSAKNEGFSHIMFLDIDEYWTPKCFSKSIKECLIEMNDPEIVAFHWKNKVNERKEFARPFQEKLVHLETVVSKILAKTDIDIKFMSSHRCICEDADPEKTITPQKADSAYLLHRFQRSETEYLSLLGRGDPKFVGKFGLKFNRAGYISNKNNKIIKIDPVLLAQYNDAYLNFIDVNGLHQDLEAAKSFVLNRAQMVSDYIHENIGINTNIKKVIQGLKIEQEVFQASTGLQNLNNTDIEMLRDIAISLENTDLNKAYELMKIAHTLNPQKKLIEKKYTQYAQALGKN